MVTAIKNNDQWQLDEKIKYVKSMQKPVQLSLIIKLYKRIVK